MSPSQSETPDCMWTTVPNANIRLQGVPEIERGNEEAQQRMGQVGSRSLPEVVKRDELSGVDELEGTMVRKRIRWSAWCVQETYRSSGQ